MRSRPAAGDNLDGMRQDAQANLYNPVLESHLEEQKRSAACEQRIRYGDIFLLLHLLEPLGVEVDSAIREFPEFYLYAGFDCTHKWSTFLGDIPRRKAMAMRLQEALGITKEEIESCREKVKSKQWSITGQQLFHDTE